MNPYTYDNSPQQAETRLIKETRDFLRYEVKLRNKLDIVYPENSVITGDYYVPKTDTPHPLLILVHGMGDYSVIPNRLLACKLVKRNIACFVPYLTIHSRRLPKAYKSNMPFLTPEQWFEVYRTSVTDIRHIIDWASGRNEINAERIYILGISFGGFVSAVTMGVDNRIKGGILIVTGGNANKVSWLSKSSRYRKRYPRTRAEHESVMDNFSNYLAEVEIDGFDNVEATDVSFYSDPLVFAPVLRDRPILMINAEKDKYLHKDTVTELWEALNKPKIRWLPSGHVTLWFWYRSIFGEISDFFDSLE